MACILLRIEDALIEVMRACCALMLAYLGFSTAVAAELPEISNVGAYQVGKAADQHSPRLLDPSARINELLVSLPQISAREAARIEDPEFSGRERIGIHRFPPNHMTGDLARKLKWRKHADGVVAYLGIRSPAAKSVRILLRVKSRAGGSLVFYESGSPGAIKTIEHVAMGTKGLTEDEYWSPDAFGETIGVEIRLKDDADIADFEIEVVRIAHRYAQLGGPGNNVTDLECTGHQDAPCAVDNGDINASTINSTLLLAFEKDDGSYVCTGVLMNVTDGEDVYIPYVLTAAHCIDNNDVAETLVTHWFYQASSCGASDRDPKYQRISGGAAVLATLASADMTLLQLNNDAASGAWFSGWWTADVGSGESAHGVHHPASEHKKYFAGTTRSKRTISVCDDGEDCTTLYNAIRLRVENGASEGGSSGSGLQMPHASNNRDRLVGILSASDETCRDGTAYFGELRQFYSHIEEWFDPDTDDPNNNDNDDDHGDTTDTATLVALGSTTRGTIDSSEDLDYFRVEVIETGELEVYTSGSLDTVGRLLDKDGNEIAKNDDEGSFSHNFKISQDVNAGTYFVEVDGYLSLTGSYNLHVNFMVPDDHGNSWFYATTIESSSRSWEYSTPGTIEEPSDVDMFEIEVAQESTVTLYTVGRTDTKGILMDRSENELLSNEDSSDSNSNFRISETLKQGRYYLQITANAKDRASYELKVEVDAN